MGIIDKPSTLLLLSLLTLAAVSCQAGRPVRPTNPLLTQAYATIEAGLTGTAEQPRPSDTTAPTVSPLSPTETLRPPQTTAPVQRISSTVESSVCDWAAPGTPIDVTIPDDTELDPGQSFTKVWRLENVGGCAWTTGYSVELFSGDGMDAPQRVFLPETVAPGQVVDIAVDMVAPRRAGKYQGNWKLRGETGEWFGIGPNGNLPFWVRIVVRPLPATATAPVLVPPSPGLTPTPAVEVSATVTLTLGSALDLDFNQIDPASGEDLRYELSAEAAPVLVPVGSLQWGMAATAIPDLVECTAVEKHNEPLAVAGLLPDQYVCYRTNLGLPGWLRVELLEPASSTLFLHIYTWSLP